MLTRLQAFIAHIKLAWQLLFSSHLATIAVISALLESPIYKGAIFSCNKGQIDKDLKVAGNDTLRSEAVEWAGHWYKANNVKNLQLHPRFFYCVCSYPPSHYSPCIS